MSDLSGEAGAAATDPPLPAIEHRAGTNPPKRGIVWSALLGLVIVGALLRVWAFPQRYYYYDIDEYDYVHGGAYVFEGLPPTLHYAFAGPETWFSWCYTAGLSTRYMVAPTAEERAVPLKVRPYVAANHAIWDITYDLTNLRLAYVALTMLVSMGSIFAGYWYGLRRGGLAGAVLLGGLAALLPVLLTHSALAKPYGLAWSCAIIATCFAGAAEARPGRWIASAIFLGLAISSRVEMLALLPLLILMELWPQRTSFRTFLFHALKYAGLTIIVVMLVSPWSYMNLMGNLRAIATLRFGPGVGEKQSFWQMLMSLFGSDAVGIPALIVVAGIGLRVTRRDPAADARFPWLAAIWVLLLLPSIFFATGYGMRHQGPAFMSMLLFAPVAAGVCARVYPRAGWTAIGLALLIAGAQSAIDVHRYRNSYVPDGATEWVNQHVPPGSIVYLNRTYKDPLPTTESANRIWDEVITRDAAKRKFDSGAVRMGLGHVAMPAALSDQSMMTERLNARRYYILGSREDRAGPRFDVRRYLNSAVFGIQHPVQEFTKTGGVLIWRDDKPLDGVGAPLKTWVNAAGRGTYVYVSDDMRSKLAPGKVTRAEQESAEQARRLNGEATDATRATFGQNFMSMSRVVEKVKLIRFVI